MSYTDIFVMGWNLNIVMFVINFFIILRVVSNKQKDDLRSESEVLRNLKAEFDHYYPYRKYMTMVTYIIPFTAFFRMSYRLLEMYMFLNRNSGSSVYDYMMYKYEMDIALAKQKND